MQTEQVQPAKATRKKNRHYVFQAYLKPWAEVEQIWCLRNGEIFRTNLRNVACERFFYRSYPLTDEEREFVNKVMIDDSPERVKVVLQKFMQMYCIGHEIKKREKRQPSWNDERRAIWIHSSRLAAKTGTQELKRDSCHS